MTFREKAQESADEAKESRTQEEVDGIELDGEPWVKFGTGVFPTGVFPEGEGNPVIRFPSPDNNNGRYDQGYLGLVWEDPEFVVDEDESTGGTIILDTDSSDGTEYRVYNGDSKQTNVIEGTGVEFAGSLYKGDIIEPSEFDEDRIVLAVQGGGSFSVARALDVRGITARQVWDDEGGYPTTNGGLVEYNPGYPENGEPRKRYTRYDVEVRDELLGTRVGILCDWHSEFDEDVAEEVADDDNDRRDSKFFTVFNMDEEESLTPGDYGEPINRTYLEWTWDENFSADDADQITVEDLNDEETEFVEAYRQAGQDTDRDTVEQAVEAESDNFEGDVDEEAIVEVLTQ